MRPLALILATGLALASAGCVAPGASTEPEPPAGLQQPTFTPLPTDAGTAPSSPSAAPVADDPLATDAPTAVGTMPDDARTPPVASAPASPEPPPSPASESRAEADPATTPAGEAADPAVRGALSDGTGDLRGLAAARAPDHADLRQLDLVVGTQEAQIRIAFAAPAPESAEGDSILNVATYHDVTGDGHIDYEIWASLTSDGWGTSWFDIREGTARFAADDDVEVEVVDGALLLTFPPSHLGGARSGRWLASSEWGTVVDMSAGASAKDDAPDDRTGQAWPS